MLPNTGGDTWWQARHPDHHETEHPARRHDEHLGRPAAAVEPRRGALGRAGGQAHHNRGQAGDLQQWHADADRRETGASREQTRPHRWEAGAVCGNAGADCGQAVPVDRQTPGDWGGSHGGRVLTRSRLAGTSWFLCVKASLAF